MFPLDFLMMILIPILLGLYVIFVIRLRSEREIQVRLPMRESKRERVVVENKSPENKASKEITSSHKREAVSSVNQTGKRNGKKDSLDQSSKNEKNAETNRKKSFYLFGENDFRGCTNKLGHLNNLPKNTPIPGECFGCPKILECLKFPSS
jgi:hypothetical protein